MADTKEKLIRDLLRKAPKPELHLHLDGSLSFSFIQSMVLSIKIHDPERYAAFFPPKLESLSEIELSDYLWSLKELQNSEGDIACMNNNWKVFDFCNQFLQTKFELKEAVYDIIKSHNEKYGVDYIEVRFAPCLHTLKGLSENEVIDSVIDGFSYAKETLHKTGIYINGGIILCALRSFAIVNALNLLEHVSKTNVIGIDIAGDEGTYPLSLFQTFLQQAKDKKICIAVHAGEWNSKKYPTVLDNLRLAIEIGVDRIGHGLAIKYLSEDLIETLVMKDIGVEVCLTANCGNPEKCSSYSEHPIRSMLEKGIKVTGLNCDNTLLSGNRMIGRPDPLSECVKALLYVKILPIELVTIIENGYNGGFHKDAKIQGTRSCKVWRKFFLPALNEILKDQ